MFLSWYEDERGKIEEWHSELTILTGEQRENFTLCIRIDIYLHTQYEQQTTPVG